jgi:hypothetical protein
MTAVDQEHCQQFDGDQSFSPAAAELVVVAVVATHRDDEWTMYYTHYYYYYPLCLVISDHVS